MNKAILIGRLTSKPELKYTQSNIAVTEFTIAINRAYKNAQGDRETDFINCRVWKKQAENVCQYLDKGSLVAVEGRIETSNFTDKEGNKRHKTIVQAENVKFLESKKATEEPQEQNKQVEDPFSAFGESITIDDNFLD